MNEQGPTEKSVIVNAETFGQFAQMEDGYWYYWVGSRGALTAFGLRVLADELDRRNAPWGEQVRRDIGIALRPRISTIVLLAVLLALVIAACLFLYI